ncbi:hypothetical protein ATANTOWER_029662 [Ataeniobius toweri]|uniref:Uncharacterized protein n=1 Tax=Ataeniobius toweri TaxID=208326 RepID=A0ABU7A411_9TELE|nr:hypothetical protein [Ataeniobius toweri]
MSMLDFCFPNLLSLFKAKKGAAEQQQAEINILLQKGIAIEKTTVFIIQCLTDHLGEDVIGFIKYFKENASEVCVQEVLAEDLMKMYLLQNQDESVQPTDVRIITDDCSHFTLGSQQSLLLSVGTCPCFESEISQESLI